MTTALPTKPKWEMADVFRRFGPKYQLQHVVPTSHSKVMNDIVDCRTAALGGHMEECDSCDYKRPVYNSCRNRHCPKCQTMAKEKWLEDRKADLLPVPYFHNVFTLPHELNDLVLANKRLLLGLLFQEVSKTLLQFGKDPRSRLGGRVGFTLVLHTWNQTLLDHFHLHCVIPAGALSADERRWIASKNERYLFSVKALAKVFRSKYLEGLKQAFDKGKVVFSGQTSHLKNPDLFDDLICRLYAKDWVVYSKAPFGGPEKVLEYLGRYTHRVAISNHRLANIDDDSVTFSYRDRNDASQKKVMTLTGHEFIRRFMLHVLPRGFMRIRHYGLLASRTKTKALNACRQTLGVSKPEPTTKKSPEQRLFEICGIDLFKCPCCNQGRMQKTLTIHPGQFSINSS